MKANEAPEKIYLEKVYPDNGILPNGLNYTPSPTDIEYTRTDAFIEKSVAWLKEHKEAVETEDNGISGWIPDYFIEDFRNYMEGE